MIRDERLAAAMAGLPEACREAVEPVLRTLIHDLNGALSVVTMEVFAIDELAASLGRTAGAGRSPRSPRPEPDRLRESVRNLREAADGAAAYVARVEALTDELRK